MRFGSRREIVASSKTYRKVIKILRKELDVKIKATNFPSADFERAVRKLKKKRSRR